MNLYAYVANDPVNATDPTGEFGIWGAVVGAIAEVAIIAVVTLPRFIRAPGGHIASALSSFIVEVKEADSKVLGSR